PLRRGPVTPLTLVADGVENPWNARSLLHAAAMFGAACRFRDRKGLAAAWRETMPGEPSLPLVTLEELRAGDAPIVAFDTLEGAEDVYGFRLPAAGAVNHGPRAPGSKARPGRASAPGVAPPSPAVVVGNERHGIAEDVRSLADCALRIPLPGRGPNALNV